MGVVDSLTKQRQTTECINYQVYHEKPTRARVDSYAMKGICNVLKPHMCIDETCTVGDMVHIRPVAITFPAHGLGYKI